MVAKNSTGSTTTDREIVVERVVEAPREDVFAAFTDPNGVDRWWGPNGFTNTNLEMNVTPGGLWRHVMRGPDGADYHNTSVFTEVSPPARLAYTHRGPDDAHPVLFDATVTFAERGNATAITMRMLFPTAEERDRMANEYAAIDAANQTLERFAQFISKKQ